MSQESMGSSGSPDSEMHSRGCTEAELSTALALEQARQAAVPGSSKDLPPGPGYLAPDIMPPDVPPPPIMPLDVPPPPVLPPGNMPDASDWSQQFRPVLPFSKAPPYRERVLLQTHGLLPKQYLTGSPACNVPSEYNEAVSQALAVLDLLRTGPSVPPLPPSGCYGGIFVSSAISEGLGIEAAGTAEAVAREFSERPVKVLLPWHPADAGIAMFDKTKPAKITLT